ncbi:hypothetical protein [Candidatus Avelusimicrobium luingense]|uniref:hypothetical protein n=1 Tax=Candidatus Avelusimicrobium luingense TaxID=3416211 RepID=UPI003D101681
MKKSVFIIALLALSPVVYAHGEVSPCVRDSVLDIFARFNPDVLEKAKQDPQYNEILESFLRSYQENNASLQDTADLIAVARNFDRSIALNALTNTYHDMWLSAKMSGADISQMRKAFRSDVRDIMQGIWVTTVNLREYQLEQAQNELKDLPSNSDHFVQKRNQLKAQIKSLKKEIKNLKKDAGNYIVSATDNYVENTEHDFLEKDFLQERQAAKAHENTAAQTSNLQIKTDHKKPVAK